MCQVKVLKSLIFRLIPRAGGVVVSDSGDMLPRGCRIGLWGEGKWEFGMGGVRQNFQIVMLQLDKQ